MTEKYSNQDQHKNKKKSNSLAGFKIRMEKTEKSSGTLRQSRRGGIIEQQNKDQ